MAVHWSLVRKWAHYPSDVLTGGALGICVALAVWKLWPPRRSAHPDAARISSSAADEGASGRLGPQPLTNRAEAPLAGASSEACRDS